MIVPAKFRLQGRRDYNLIVAHALTTDEPFSIGEYKTLIPINHIMQRGLIVRNKKKRERNGDTYYEVFVSLATESDWLNVWNNAETKLTPSRSKWMGHTYQRAWRRWERNSFRGTAYDWFSGYFDGIPIPRTIARKLR